MSSDLKNKKLPPKKLPIDYLESANSTVSARECTGLTPRAIKTEAETESYNELYNVDVPESDFSGDRVEESDTK
jgi:hypothetical protein